MQDIVSVEKLHEILRATGVTENKVTLLAGGPGSGKSYLIKALCTYTHSVDKHTCIIGFENEWNKIAKNLGGIVYEIPSDFRISTPNEIGNVLKDNSFVVLDMHQLITKGRNSHVLGDILNQVFNKFIMAEGKGHLYIDESGWFFDPKRDIYLEDCLKLILCASECDKGLVMTSQIIHKPYQLKQIESLRYALPEYRPILDAMEVLVLLGLDFQMFQALNQDINKMSSSEKFYHGRRLSIPRLLGKLTSLVAVMGNEISVSGVNPAVLKH
jgi:ATPases of the AAA+ class